jgi:hypothetical protein
MHIDDRRAVGRSHVADEDQAVLFHDWAPLGTSRWAMRRTLRATHPSESVGGNDGLTERSDMGRFSFVR